MKKEFTSFDKVKKFARSLNLKSYKEWVSYCKSKNIPDNMPTTPNQVYKNEWISWGDFLGTGNLSSKQLQKSFRTFEDARNFAHALNLKNVNNWRKFCKSDQKPDNISSIPYRTYKNEWISWGDFLGTGNLSSKQLQKSFRTFEDARNFAHALNLKNSNEWKKFCKSNKKPDNIPKEPGQHYKNKGWKSMGDFLGTNFKSFESTRQFAQSLNLKGMRDWNEFCKSGKKPNWIPKTPQGVYVKQWLGWGNFLGTRNVSSQNKQFRSFEEAREFIHSLNLKSFNEWRGFCRSGNKPYDIPYTPSISYKNKGWTTWGDFLGTRTIASYNKIFRTFDDARKFVHLLGLKNHTEWEEYSKSSNKPDDIPAIPQVHYKNKGWTTWGDFLGTITSRNKQFRNFQDVKKLVQKLKLFVKITG